MTEGHHYLFNSLDRLNGDTIAKIDAGGFLRTDIELKLAEFDDYSYGTFEYVL